MLRLLLKVFQMQSRVSVLLKWRSALFEWKMTAEGIAWDGIARLSMNLCHCQDFFSCFAHRYQLLSCGDATVSKMLKCQDRAEREMSFDMLCAFEDVHWDLQMQKPLKLMSPTQRTLLWQWPPQFQSSSSSHCSHLHSPGAVLWATAQHQVSVERLRGCDAKICQICQRSKQIEQPLSTLTGYDGWRVIPIRASVLRLAFAMVRSSCLL